MREKCHAALANVVTSNSRILIENESVDSDRARTALEALAKTSTIAQNAKGANFIQPT